MRAGDWASEVKEGGKGDRCLQVAAVLMTLSPGSARGFYTAMSGWYIHLYNDRSFFITMLFCFNGPATIASLLQQEFDGYFDGVFSAKVTYPFRVICMQLVLGCIVLAWILGKHCFHSWFVLTIGVLLGFVSFSIFSSSLQVVAAAEPTYIILTKIGMHCGGVLTIIVLTCSGFNPSSSKEEFQWVVSLVVVVTVLAACTLAYFNLTSDVFTKAYERLERMDSSYDLTTTGEGTGEDEPLVADPFVRQITLTIGLHPEASMRGVPSWVRHWQAFSCLLTGSGYCLFCLAGYFGDSDLAQMLALLKMLMEFVGRILSCFVPFAACFADGPWHKVMAANVITGLCLFGVCLAKLFGTALGDGPFLMSWCCVHGISRFNQSLGDVTTGSYVNVRDRKSVARTNQLVSVSSALVGLLAGKAISKIHENIFPM